MITAHCLVLSHTLLLRIAFTSLLAGCRALLLLDLFEFLEIFMMIGWHHTDHWTLLLRNTGALLRADSHAHGLIPAAKIAARSDLGVIWMTHFVLKLRPHPFLMSRHCWVATVLHCCCITTSHSWNKVSQYLCLKLLRLSCLGKALSWHFCWRTVMHFWKV